MLGGVCGGAICQHVLGVHHGLRITSGDAQLIFNCPDPVVVRLLGKG